ncbi:hypothetical protein HRbin36_01006 [bacterium HR36]|nr:hypothetical protein HRbin36_01006 [bacterium HR36]
MFSRPIPQLVLRTVSHEHHAGAAGTVQNPVGTCPGTRSGRRGDAQVEGQRHSLRGRCRRGLHHRHERRPHSHLPAHGRRPHSLDVCPAQSRGQYQLRPATRRGNSQSVFPEVMEHLCLLFQLRSLRSLRSQAPACPAWAADRNGPLDIVRPAATRSDSPAGTGPL